MYNLSSMDTKTVKIDAGLHNALKKMSKETGIRIQFAIDQAIVEWFKAHKIKQAA